MKTAICLKTTKLARNRRGLTLIELVVVMMILVAIAGLIVPMLPGMTARAHTSTSASNAGEVSKAIQTYQALFLGYPNNFDSLVTDLTTGTPATYLHGGGTDVTTVTLAEADGTLDALLEAGITGVTQMVEQADGEATGIYKWSPTFFPYAAPLVGSTPLTVNLADGHMLMGITGLAAAREFNVSPTAQYVLFGLGKYSTLAKVMQEAPVHFDDDGHGAPNVAYARYAAVFQITDATGTAGLEKAKLVGIVSFHEGEVTSIGDHLAEYWASND